MSVTAGMDILASWATVRV